MSQITMTKTRPGGASGVLEMGKTYTVGTDLSATLADALVRQGKAVAAGGTWVAPTPINSITAGNQPLALGGPIIDPATGALIGPSGNRPESGAAFLPTTCVWQLVARCAVAATVTVSRTIGASTSAIGAISITAGGVGSDYFEREYGATYSWSASVSGVTVEVM